MTDSFVKLTAQQLRRAAALRTNIDALEKQLVAVLNLTAEAPMAARRAGRPRRKAAVTVARRRRISRAARAKMAAAARARWAKAKAAGKRSL
jgi:hypothetical protein